MNPRDVLRERVANVPCVHAPHLTCYPDPNPDDFAHPECVAAALLSPENRPLLLEVLTPDVGQSAGDRLAEATKPWDLLCSTGHLVSSSCHDEDDACPAPNCTGTLGAPSVDPYLVPSRLLANRELALEVLGAEQVGWYGLHVEPEYGGEDTDFLFMDEGHLLNKNGHKDHEPVYRLAEKPDGLTDALRAEGLNVREIPGWEPVKCRACNGTGHTAPCPICNGSGGQP